MIIILGEIVMKSGEEEAMLAAARRHVERSRTVEGCISHEICRDDANPSRLVFVQRWTAMPALQAHFASAETQQFSQAAHRYGGGPVLTLYDAAELAQFGG